jgi:hypothetical protein
MRQEGGLLRSARNDDLISLKVIKLSSLLADQRLAPASTSDRTDEAKTSDHRHLALRLPTGGIRALVCGTGGIGQCHAILPALLPRYGRSRSCGTQSCTGQAIRRTAASFAPDASLERNMSSAAEPALSSLTISSAWRKIRFFRTARCRDESACQGRCSPGRGIPVPPGDSSAR